MKTRPLNIANKDVVMKPKGGMGTTWITVGNLSIHIIKHQNSVVIAAYPEGHELTPALGEFEVLLDEARTVIEREEKLNAGE